MNKCWYCGKELKNENDKEHIGICDKCYQESFKVGNTVLTKLIKYKTDKDQKIADLEAKLAEKEKENRELHTAINLSIPNQIAMKDEIERLHTCVDKRIGELVEENTQLKQQLAEKEEEIDKLEDKLHHYYEETLNNGTCGLCEHLRGEYKTDFAIEQLEKVKVELINNVSPVKLSYTDYVQEVFNKIYQQIKELKEGK